MSTLSSYTIPFSPDGKIQGYALITHSPQGVHRLEWAEKPSARPLPAGHKPLHKALRDYQSGKRVEHWPLSVIPSGTAFQQKVWRQLAKIPYGQTISYTELAARAGKPAAVRAAASACARNPAPLLIPCHRVIAKNGGLGGFGWGLPIKQALLDLEKAGAR